MKVRQYNANDLESVLHTWEVASQVGHPFLSEQFLESERKNIPSVYIRNGDTWVATIQGSVVGFTILHGNEVGALFVNPEFHGNGIGFALMNKAKEIHGELKVEVFKENIIGNQFYSRYGFALIREYLHQETEMTMLCLEYRKDS